MKLQNHSGISSAWKLRITSTTHLQRKLMELAIKAATQKEGDCPKVRALCLHVDAFLRNCN
jgi:hypothetical protein